MTSLEERFEAKVDRSGKHHLWTGSKKADGTGILKVQGKVVTAQRVAWELAHGPLASGIRVNVCPDEKACVRIDHLSLSGQAAEATPQHRAAPGEGSMDEIRPGVWKITVTRGRYDDGSHRRAYTTVKADNETEATRLKAAFIAEIDQEPLPATKDDRDLTVDQVVDKYLQYLKDDRGREARTIRNYRNVHERWFAPKIGKRRIRDVDEETLESIFGEMRRAGLSRSRMADARNLYRPMYRWAKRRRIVRRNPLADFELPKSKYISRQRRPPEVEQLCWLLAAAVQHVPDIAAVLTLGATTGMRRGELVVPRRDGFDPVRGELVVATAADLEGVKATKVDTERTVALDQETVDMLQRHIEQMNDRAARAGDQIAPDAYIFSLELDCSEPMSPDYLTKRLAVLKDHLGIANKRPSTVALENKALALFRGNPEPRQAGRPGPQPKGALSYREIGQRLRRSTRWAQLAVAAAQRRQAAAAIDQADLFDGSILGLRKFTSSELLDSGFNVAVVAQRQGHGPEVLVKHYSKTRRSADRRAAEHLGRLIHKPTTPEPNGPTPYL